MGFELRNITKSFDDKLVISRFSYTFSDSGLYIIKGESGSGKTTLLRIIAGIDKKFDGEILGYEDGDCSFCFQEYRLFPHLNAVKNLSVASFEKASDNDIEACKQLLLRLKFSERDLKLYPTQLSGGMRQRVAFARAILKDSKILLLDEPTKEIDSSVAEIMHEIILEQALKRTVILVTHKNEDISALNGEIIHLSAISTK